MSDEEIYEELKKIAPVRMRLYWCLFHLVKATKRFTIPSKFRGKLNPDSMYDAQILKEFSEQHPYRTKVLVFVYKIARRTLPL